MKGCGNRAFSAECTDRGTVPHCGNMTVTKKAYAKINLYLDVMGKRPDGYHDIQSVMMQVSLHDTVTVSRDGGEGIRLTDMGDELPCGEGNIAYRCADAFLRHYDLREGVSIRIDKHIPIAAGLGGGSADGAAVLTAMSDLFSDTLPADLDTLCAIGSTVGADIPFCVVGGCARTLGIGDRITPLEYHPDCTVLLARDGSGISTPQAYRALDEMYGDRLVAEFGDFAGFLDSLTRNETVPSHMRNTFEDVILPQHSEARALRERMERGGGTALMSGSGPSVFGLFADRTKAETVYRELQQDGIESYLCHAVSRI